MKNMDYYRTRIRSAEKQAARIGSEFRKIKSIGKLNACFYAPFFLVALLTVFTFIGLHFLFG